MKLQRSLDIASDGDERGTAPVGRIISIRTLFSFVLALAAIILVITNFNFDLKGIIQNIKHTNPLLYLTALVFYYFSIFLRSLRWRILAVNATTKALSSIQIPALMRTSQFMLIGWFVNSIAGFRLGDIYKAYSFSQYTGSGFSWALGTILAERIIDLAILFLLLTTGLFLASSTSMTQGWNYLIVSAALVGISLGLLIAMRQFGIKLANLMPRKFKSAYQNFHQGALGSFKQLPFILGLSMAIWMIDISRLIFVVHALDLSLTIPLAIVITICHAILSSAPTPGGIGAVEIGLTTLLIFVGLNQSDAGAVVIIERSITYFSVIVIGGVAFLFWQISPVHRSVQKNRI